MNRWSAALTALVFGLAGCHSDSLVRKTDSPSAPTTGGMTPTTGSASRKPPDMTYRFRQSPEVQQELAQQDRVRAGDPCSRLSPDAVLALGKVSYFGSEPIPNQCRVIFDTPEEQNSVHEITIGWHPNAGEPAGAYPSKNRCDYNFDVDGQPDLMAFTLDQGYDVRGDNGAKLCGIAESLVKASTTTLGSPPSREGSRWVPQDKLMRLDPCGPMNVLDSHLDFVIHPFSYVFDCLFYERADSKQENKRSIEIKYVSISEAPRPKEKGPNLVDIGGVLTKAITKDSKGDLTCDYSAYVGLNEPLTGADPLSQSEQWVGTISVSGPPIDNGCSEVERLTAEAVRLYKQA